MPRRAAICIGVDRAGSMTPLKAAARGASDFGSWARDQGCDTEVLTDDKGASVSASRIFEAVDVRVKAGTYEQLIVYFAGHGILSAPGTEYWLLSGAPENPNEAVNLFRSIEDARNCGIPHVAFVSDACRSAANGLLSGISGALIFRNEGYRPTRGEIDVFYATSPGNPAWELPLEEATRGYRGIFTETLLDAVKMPTPDLVEQLDLPAVLHVITPRKLKPLLESSVPMRAAAIDVRIRQTPEVRVGTALPQYFAAIDPATIRQGQRAVSDEIRLQPTIDTALKAIRTTGLRAVGPPARDVSLAARLGLTAEVEHLEAARGRPKFETQTGFSLHGARPVDALAKGWRADPAFEEDGAWHWRFHPVGRSQQHSTLLIFETSGGVRGIALAVVPEFIASVVVDDAGRVVSVNYVPSGNSSRFAAYQRREAEIEKMKAFAAVAARHGRFDVPTEDAAAFADRIRIEKALDPTLGLYAAYAYAQVGQYQEAHSVFSYMRDDPALPVPFDVVMLATRVDPAAAAGTRYGPFTPMLSQGWALLSPGDPMFRPIHQELCIHLVPSLWTTFTGDGVAIAARFLKTERTQ